MGQSPLSAGADVPCILLQPWGEVTALLFVGLQYLGTWGDGPMQIILNADDFGRSSAINRAVILAHREGVLTSASLIVSGDAFEEAVALARATPALAVGLHLIVTHGRSVLPPLAIPHLVDHQGFFSKDLWRLSLRYAFSREARRELALEMNAQFERFAATGLPLSHVDGHLHMHLHPTVFRLLLPLAEKYGARGLRVTRDDLRLALRYDRGRVVTKVMWAIVVGLLSRWCRGRMRGHRLITTQRVYGLMQTGSMHEQYVKGLLLRLNVPTAELFFHPTVDADGEYLGPNPGDLATLLSPSVRKVSLERGLKLTTYPALYAESKGSFATSPGR